MDEATGFDVEFAKNPDSRLPTNCAICHLVLRNPCETTCCGVYFCKACLEKYQRYKQSCPNCRGKLRWQVSRAQERHIKQLKVFCEHKDRGCEWVGELGQLKEHLNENSIEISGKHCKFVLVVCDWCHKEVERGNFDQHKSEECSSREVECPYQSKGCDWMGPHSTLDQHLNLDMKAGLLEGCGFVEVSCTLYKCGQSIERRNYQQHDAACQLELIECELKSLGCEERVARKDMPAHLENYIQHLQLASINLQKVTKECSLIKSENDKLHSLMKKKLEEKKFEIERLRHMFWFFIGSIVIVLIGFWMVSGDEKRVDQLQQLNQSLLHQLQLEYSELKRLLLRNLWPDLLYALQLPASLSLEGYSVHANLGVPWISPPLRRTSTSGLFYLEVFLLDSTFSTSMYVQLRTSSIHHSKEVVFRLRPLPVTDNSSCVMNFMFHEWVSPDEVVTGYQLYPAECEPFQYKIDEDRVRFRAVKLSPK